MLLMFTFVHLKKKEKNWPVLDHHTHCNKRSRATIQAMHEVDGIRRLQEPTKMLLKPFPPRLREITEEGGYSRDLNLNADKANLHLETELHISECCW